MNNGIANFIPVGTKISNEPAMACPICGFEYIHPVGIECNSPGTAKGLLRIDSDGVHLDPKQAPIGRGVRITLKFMCEYGHSFEYQLHFHKGQTYVERRMACLPMGRHEQWPDTIWRD